tara:strand:- start:2670 stop:3170 length:501 start_codon:yes stop_codon:yes gene_type:complete
MNRFIIEDTPQKIAKSLCDQHVVKMPLEEAQMLCTALWHHAPDYAEEHNLYKPVHQKHPCTLWAMETSSNYEWAFCLYREMLFEYEDRYNKRHGASKHYDALWLGRFKIPSGVFTKHPQCFSGHDELKTDEFYPIKAYRAFYNVDKASFARYRYTQQPTWMKGVAL